MLNGSERVRVTLVERRSAFALGAAYDTGNADHLLNVRLGNMSALPDDPGHLTRWLAEQSSWEASGAFITRGTYGRYLRSLLNEALSTRGGRLSLVHGEVIDVERIAEHWRARLRTGAPIDADVVVLALGNQEPHRPPGIDAAVLASERYVADPWSIDIREVEARAVLLIGTGLTMVDVAVALRKNGPQIIALSRHGLLPRAHASIDAPPAALRFAGSPLSLLRQTRAAARVTDWRQVFDALRNDARRLWSGWGEVERRRFLRHLRPLWDVHRHRLAPTMARQVSHMIAGGELTVVGGKIVDLTLGDEGITATWRPRGRSSERTAVFDLVVNCTGPLGAVRDSRTPLIQRLLARGLAAPDPLGLGFSVEQTCQLISAEGATNVDLYAVGPLTRGTFWEMTAVPDLRLQTRQLADHILGRLGLATDEGAEKGRGRPTTAGQPFSL
ncbi:MAG: hypothetical protein EON88_01545 [Brevundimonas sp.]|nr:MAG: hypothetical protein EON88_01545 [Brevundimonas sp.]